MRFDPFRHHRRSIRLPGWDYTLPGRYFVTIMVKDRECSFGRAIDGAMEQSPLGLVADACWRQIPEHHVGVSLDEHIVMPNHVHGILIIDGKPRTDVNGDGGDVHGEDVHCRDVQLNVPTGRTTELNVPAGNPCTIEPPWRANPMNHPGDVEHRICSKKRISPAKGSLSVIIRTFKASVTTWAHVNGYGGFAWLGRFHDHIIRSERELERVRTYIRKNPLEWVLDNENPENLRRKPDR